MDESDSAPALAHLLRDRPHDDALRLVYADQLIERGDLFGELITLGAHNADPARRIALEARFLARMLGALADHVSDCRFRLGALREATDLGTAPVSLEEWRSLAAVRTGRASLVAEHAGTLREAQLDGWGAFAELCERKDPAPIEKIWPLHLTELPQSPALRYGGALSCLKLLALSGPGASASDALLPLARQILESPLPIEVLRVQVARPPTAEVLEALRAHPTLRRFEWIGGLWQREEGALQATLPALPERRSKERPVDELPAMTLHHQPLCGLDPRLWLAHDSALRLSLVWIPERYENSEESPAVEGIDVGRPMPIEDKRVARLFSPGAPLGPAPWDQETLARAEALVRSVNTRLAPDRELAEQSLERIVRRDGGELVLLAPPLVRRPPGAMPTAESALARHVRCVQPWAALTSAGSVRSINEDAWRVHPSGVWVVADGMGGHSSGEIAARHASDLWQQPGDSRALAAAIRAAISEIGGGLGAAAARVAVSGSRAEVSWIGDVRVYLLRGDILSQLTRDHTLVAHASALGRLDRTEGRHHPFSNILMRSFTAGDVEDPDEIELDLVEGDLLLILSDGVWQELDDPTLCALVARERSLEGIVATLVSEADRCGGNDNATALAIRFEG